jgi:hypothetical protein
MYCDDKYTQDVVYVSTFSKKVMTLHNSIKNNLSFNTERDRSHMLSVLPNIFNVMEEYPINDKINRQYDELLDTFEYHVSEKVKKRALLKSVNVYL